MSNKITYKHAQHMREILYTSPSDLADNQIPDIKSDKIRGAIFGYVHGLYANLRYSILKLNNDTIIKEDTNNYLNIAKDLGFKIVLNFPYYGYNGNDVTHEYLYVLWHNEYGILLKFCTMQMPVDIGMTKSIVHSGTFYFNYRSNEQKYIDDVMGDGFIYNHKSDNIWVGNLDCREALRLKIKLLVENGNFVVPWVKTPETFNLCHFGEHNSSASKVTKERLLLIKDPSFRKNCSVFLGD